MIMQRREQRITHQIQPSAQHNPYLLNWVSIAEEDQLIERLNHESRTALCIVMLTTETLQSDLLGPVTESQAQALTKIQKNTSYLKAVLEQLLQLVYAEQEKERIG